MKSQACYLVLDQGGHSSRALVFDATGQVLAQARVPVRTRCPQDNWVEQDPDELVASLQQAAEEAVAALPGEQQALLSACALVTQRSSLVCWDRRKGQALYPVISWQDRRAAAWLRQCGVSAAEVQARTGLRLSPHYGASKVRWCLDRVPAIRRAWREGHLACGPLASFLVGRLLQEHPFLTDPANASRTLLWNLHTGTWDPALLRWFGVPREILPDVVPTRYPYGHLTVANRRLPLQLLNGDQSSAFFAQGALQTDAAYINAGTGAFVAVSWPLEQAPPAQLLHSVAFTHHATLRVVEGTVNGAASALDWAQRQLGLASQHAVSDWCAAVTEPPLFLNGVGGVGSPFWQPEFASRFIGEGSAEAKMVAVVESIVFLLQANLACISHSGKTLRKLVVTGGLARLEGFCQRLADLSGLPVWRPRLREASALGAAYWLAGCPSAWGQQDGDWVRPQAETGRGLRQRYQQWLQAMRAETAE